MFNILKMHNEIVNDLNEQLLAKNIENQMLKIELRELKKLDTDQLIEHTVNQYQCGAEVKFKSKPISAVIERVE